MGDVFILVEKVQEEFDIVDVEKMQEKIFLVKFDFIDFFK